MNLGLRHSTLKQQIIMTPKLQQAIKVLKMSQLQLNEFIAQQLEQNPALEEEETQAEELEKKDLNDGNNAPCPTVPEVSIKKIRGKYQVHINDDAFPRLRLNPLNTSRLRGQDGEVSEDTENQLERQRSLAIGLIESIDQRREKIMRVTEAIFETQARFLDLGNVGLKPLILKEIAARAGLHESTVSRVTSNKYVETPHGTYELKHFFSTGLPTDSGEDVSSITVKEKIKGIIDQEDSAKPLSDQAIANLLATTGIQVARRTVQKYREDLDILSSSKRKTGASETTSATEEQVGNDVILGESNDDVMSGSANDIEFIEKQGLTILIGQVRIKCCNEIVSADKVTIRKDVDTGENIKTVAEGNVKIDNDDLSATCEHASINHAADTIDLQDNVVVLQNTHCWRAKYVTVHRRSRK